MKKNKETRRRSMSTNKKNKISSFWNMTLLVAMTRHCANRNNEFGFFEYKKVVMT